MERFGGFFMPRYLKSSLFVLLMMIPHVGNANVLFTNFGPGFAYNTAAGNVAGNGRDLTTNVYWEGDTFTPTTTAKFSILDIALSCDAAGLCPANFTVALTADSGSDSPGAVLESFTFAGTALGLLGTNNPPVVFNSVVKPTLLAGTQYWVTVSAPFADTVVWNWNTTGDMSDQAVATNGVWFSPSFMTPSAYEVDGVVAAVPEPGTVWLLASGLAAIFLRRGLLRRSSEE
jgi:hypothetical protein